MTRVIVHIDRLVLKGFRPEDRHAIAEGLRQELGRALGEAGMAERLGGRGDLPSLRLAPLSLKPQAPMGDVGQQLGKHISKEIGS